MKYSAKTKPAQLGFLFLFYLLIPNILFAQQEPANMPRFFQQFALNSDNRFAQYKKYDLAPLWLETEGEYVYGIIGDDNQRIKIKLTTITKNPKNSAEYLVTGKSAVKNNICVFNGIIRVREIREVKQMHYGVDDEYQNKGIKAQGLLIAEYEFLEQKGQPHSGAFKGKLYTLWYLDKGNNLKYDDIEMQADGYLNNAFVGNWAMYNSGLVKVCNWADYRVPNAASDFDIGAGEFSPAEKYMSKGWDSYQKAMNGDNKAKALESAAWWK